MIDVSEQLGIDDTFLLSVQPHTWRGTKYKGVDGGTNRPNEDQASQIVLIKDYTIIKPTNKYKYPRFYSTNRGFVFTIF
jgi:hypothetical protein